MNRTVSRPEARPQPRPQSRLEPRCATRPSGGRRTPGGKAPVRRSVGPAAPVARARAAGARRRWGLRLTRRGRALVVLVVAALLLAAFSLGRVSTQAVSDAPPTPAHVTVRDGETLWQVASRIAPHQDPRPIVAQIERLNGLDGAGLRAGQDLLVPRG
jgi:Tfp pilus assembly protein FimV